jgi:hypothetical protein
MPSGLILSEGKILHQHLLAGECGQHRRQLMQAVPTALSEGGCSAKGQGKFLFLGWETILEGG